MFKKVTLPKLSSKYLQLIPLDFLEDSMLELTNEQHFAPSPPHSIYLQHPYSSPKTQKLSPIHAPIPSDSKHRPLGNSYHFYKENLLDLDLCFNLESSKNCQNEKPSDRNSFVIKTKRTPSAISKHKETSLGSTDNSLEAAPPAEHNGKIETDSPQTKLSSCRGQSYSKKHGPCRIVNSKKLPFNMCGGNRKMRWNMQLLQLDISMIEKQGCGDMLSYQSMESILGGL